MNRAALKRRVAATTYRALWWGRHRVSPGMRSVIGVLLMVGGVLGFLPILGFWMLPLGVAFVGLDLPFSRHRIDAWMHRLAREAQAPDQPTSSQ